MNAMQQEVIQFVRENDVKFIRLAFVDLFGNMKNISIQPGELERALNGGFSFDASAVKGFLNVTRSEIFLMPDVSTLCVLPWRPQTGRVVRLLCDCRYPDGTPYESYSRQVLRDQAAAVEKAGYQMKIGTECEFYLFKADEDGEITPVPQDRAGYMDVAPLDKGENVRREICLNMEDIHIRPCASHHEQGPGQNEIDFQHADPLTAADQILSFKSAVQNIAVQYGVRASFMPKPIAGESGSGMHVNLSLYRNGENLFDAGAGQLSPEAGWAMAGILSRIRDITLFLNPLPNSYARLGRCEAPRYVSWSRGNRSQLIRIPSGCGENARMELRSPDCTCNPYLAIALIAAAAMEGIETKAALPAPVSQDLFTDQAATTGLACLPATLEEAIALAKESDFLKKALPAALLEKYLAEKEALLARYQQSALSVFQQHFQTI